MPVPKLTRREAVAAAVLVPAAPVMASESAAISGLNLSAELETDLRKRAEAAIQEARWLEELPLHDVDPGFVFTPR
jgi:hypothetical protein